MRFEYDQKAWRYGQSPTTSYVAAGLFTLAGLVSVVTFSGWLLDILLLRSFGAEHRPIWPWTAIGFAALSAGFLALVLEKRRMALLFWGLPLTIALATIFQNISGLDLGTDRLLFADLVSQYPGPHPGRTGTVSCIVLILLATAGLGTLARASLREEAAALAATATLGLAAASAGLILFSSPGEQPGQFLSVSIPAALLSILLALAFILLHSNIGWVRAVAVSSGEWHALRLLLPLALVLPVVPSLLELLIQDRGLFSPFVTEMFVVVCNMLIVALIAYWAVTRVIRGQARAMELTHALDVTTVLLTDPEGRITHWSHGCQQLYGWSQAEALGQQKYALLRSYCTVNDDMHDSTRLELIETCRDGREIHVLERVQSVHTPGQPPTSVHKVTDISERVAAIEALRASEERLAIATTAHELGVFEWYVNSGEIEWSPGTEQRLGVPPGSINTFEKWRLKVEQVDIDVISADVARAVREHLDKISFRYRLSPEPGSVRSIEGSARLFYTAKGEVDRCVGFIMDVTARDEHERELRRREAQLRSVLETVPDPMIVIDEAAVVLQFSAAAERLWGYSAAEVIGHQATMLIPLDRREIHMAVLRRFRERGEGLQGEISISVGEASDGRNFPMEVRTGIARSGGQLLFTMFVRDLTEQRENEARLSELNNEIAHVSRQSAMSELAADLAHELNQPLAATSNFLAAARMLLERGEQTERVTELLRMGSEQTLRAGEIIRRLRAFMARGEVEMRAESVERTVRDAAELVMVGTAQFQIRVAYQLDPEIRFMFADRIQVQQVLVNLMRNAMEALRNSDREDRLIIISSRKCEDHMIEISVNDNGPGLPSHVLEQLFSRFTTTKGAGGGMGIGLSISKRIIEAHGGALSADNRPEGGASFRFTVPTVEEGIE
ncbi:PAS domain S-box protein [Sphingomonas sp. MMS12-HWE2-04]|uniref:PAS domain S-box protein n=1 Tax=Sphingomonas sp. MMS12-HWE2-04 TaxID=3234199 RepID=UPI00384E4FFA